MVATLSQQLVIVRKQAGRKFDHVVRVEVFDCLVAEVWREHERIGPGAGFQRVAGAAKQPLMAGTGNGRHVAGAGIKNGGSSAGFDRAVAGAGDVTSLGW